MRGKCRGQYFNALKDVAKSEMYRVGRIKQMSREPKKVKRTETHLFSKGRNAFAVAVFKKPVFFRCSFQLTIL